MYCNVCNYHNACRDKDALLKEAINDYEVQLEISGSLTAKAR